MAKFLNLKENVCVMGIEINRGFGPMGPSPRRFGRDWNNPRPSANIDTSSMTPQLKLGVLSLIMSIIGLFFFLFPLLNLVLPTIGFVLSIVSLRKGKNVPAIIALIISSITLLMIILIYLAFISLFAGGLANTSKA
jgi:hypothetical protein